jgi:protein-S-isoprenylcysteine O-methyltransferase Ste14
LKRRLLRSIIILPGTVVVFVPAVFVLLSRESSLAAMLASPSQAVFWLGLMAIATGLVLAIWTSKLFLEVGEGTPAPWDPPKKFVVLGPYRHVRNPMISGVLFMLLGEALLLQSLPIFGWMAIFFLANAIYLPNIEERDLEGRFGEPYLEYKKHVRRWVPRISPWMGP